MERFLKSKTSWHLRGRFGQDRFNSLPVSKKRMKEETADDRESTSFTILFMLNILCDVIHDVMFMSDGFN